MVTSVTKSTPLQPYVLFVSSSILGKKDSNSKEAIKALDGIGTSQWQFLLLFNACTRHPETQKKVSSN